jgi:hypothetical protein
MAKEETPDQIANRTFVVTMIGTVLFIAVVALFILWQ